MSEQFEISELHGASRLNQGHYFNTIKGSYVASNMNFTAGTIVVRMAQPLGKCRGISSGTGIRRRSAGMELP